VKAYLFTIVRNLYLLEIRRSSRHVELPDALPSPANEPERHIDQQAALATVFRALRTLPEVDRAALLRDNPRQAMFLWVAAFACW
jgi:DNA-directed RNA polymerase specialized sigma24 family protein